MSFWKVHLVFEIACIIHNNFSIHKIVGCTTLSRSEHTTAQTRESACTKVVLPQVLNRGK